MRIVFFGSGAFALPTLEALTKAHEVVRVVTQPDKPAGRGASISPTPVAAWLASRMPHIPLFKPVRCADPASVAEILATRADAYVVIAYAQKLPRELLSDRFAINLHASLLPRWRGAAPINWAILAGDAETGNSVITLADRMDAGDILAQSRRLIAPTMTAGDLHDQLAAEGPALVEQVLRDFTDGALRPQPQDESRATLAPRLHRSDAWVDFSENAETCRRRINALSPWPGVSVAFRSESLRLLRADAASHLSVASPGTVIDPRVGLVACADGTTLRLLEVQPPGGRVMPWRDFANGRRVQAEERLIGGRPL
jgi:methionyl-tRNA formyltransferase